ncbi:FkbM family methyltransferase [Flammeovirga aprica]|uniref:FkbM family methyltransferase n=1 Tax=Flammeovirga aprica JL-4 TaxID=694437 RepID=A0A7X9S1U7_9BACT|nr:FkbM family methyltransferase [Flammeovirga aprica]NME72622.1 FkbM family methyltransferase [Flammeovirga aprica JL-4]
MDYSDNKQIYRKIKEKGLALDCVCEVGVYYPETSNILDFVNQGVRTILVEPSDDSLKRIDTFFENKDNITIHPVAVSDKNGTLELSKAEASTFISDLPKSPALINDNFKVTENETVTVPCVTFDKIDTLDIDLLSIDIEGAEWYVIQNLKSRPKVISIETHGKFYTNPYINEITQWINENNYKVWYKDHSDTVFYKEGELELTSSEKFALTWMNFRINLRRSKKYIFWPYYQLRK